VAGSFLMLVSLGLGVGGAALGFVDQTQRDDAGFLMSDHTQLATSTYAIVSDNVVLDSGGAPTGIPHRLLGDLKVTVHTGPSVPVFLGIASTADVQRYLGGVERATVTDVTPRPEYDLTGGTAPATPPAAQGIWVAQATGTGDQQLVWPVENGDWTLVMMNADGQAQVVGDVAVGATAPALDWIWPSLLVAAVVAVMLASVLIFVAFRRSAEARPTA
jgi:hypothetical protein